MLKNMKKNYILLVMSFGFINAQKINDSVYSNLINEIKNSKIVADYCNAHECNSTFKVSTLESSICEFTVLFHKTNIYMELNEYCENLNLLEHKFLKNNYLKNKSDTEEQDLTLHFSEEYKNHIAAEVKLLNKNNNESIIFLFKIIENRIEKIAESKCFLN